jgi:hypothetical protein
MPQKSKAILLPSSRFVYQQLSRYIAPEKKGASMMPRKKWTMSRPNGEFVALVQPLITAQAMMQDGYEV